MQRGRARQRRSDPESRYLAHMPIWSPQQDAALKSVSRWLADRPGSGAAQVFRLFGYAGTGKTTLARHIAESVDGKVIFAAFTGKAALVMRGKGCEGAQTIHSLIYRSRGVDEEAPTFVLNHDSAAAKAKLIIIDECSMVDESWGAICSPSASQCWCWGTRRSFRRSKAAAFSPKPSRTPC